MHAHERYSNLEHHTFSCLLLQFDAKDGAAAQGWTVWVAKYASFFFECLRQYASMLSKPDRDEAAEAAGTLPCVRLAHDLSFLAKLMQVCQITETRLVGLWLLFGAKASATRILQARFACMRACVHTCACTCLPIIAGSSPP